VERAGERELLRSGDRLEAHVLKVPHHGGWTSSSWALLSRVKPEVAVLSAARPWAGHPSLSVLSRYQQAGARLFRTDEDGAVELLSDGEGYWVRSHLREARTFQGFLPLKGRTPFVPRELLPAATLAAR
jgi:competence protein ComEC